MTQIVLALSETLTRCKLYLRHLSYQRLYLRYKI
jgi:hypothetical protein